MVSNTYFPSHEVPEDYSGENQDAPCHARFCPRVEALSTGKQAASYDEVRETHKLDQSLYAFFDLQNLPEATKLQDPKHGAI